MKETDKVRWLMFLGGVIVGASIALFLVASGVVHAQEGCGEWVTTKWDMGETQRFIDPPCAWYIYWFPFPLGDSVWIEKPCPEERNWWDPPLDTISIDTTCKIWENIRHSGGAFSLFLKETKVLPMKIKEGTIDSIVWESKCRRGDSTWWWNPETKKWERSK